MTWSESAWLAVFILGSAGAIWWLSRRPKRPSYRTSGGFSITAVVGTIPVLIYMLGQLAFIVGAGYVVMHFIVKYW